MKRLYSHHKACFGNSNRFSNWNEMKDTWDIFETFILLCTSKVLKICGIVLISFKFFMIYGIWYTLGAKMNWSRNFRNCLYLNSYNFSSEWSGTIVAETFVISLTQRNRKNGIIIAKITEI